MSSAAARHSDMDLPGAFLVSLNRSSARSGPTPEPTRNPQIDPSHHIVDWTLSKNAETALARGQETSLIDICMPKQLTTVTVGPVRAPAPLKPASRRR